MAEKEANRRDFLNAGVLGLGVLIFPKILSQESSSDNFDYVVQTGDRVFEIDGRKYEVTCDEKAVVGLTLLMAELRGGEELKQKTEKWFVNNKLEMTLWDKENIFKIGEFNHRQDMKQVVFYKSVVTNGFNYFKDKGSEPPLTIPHELTHLIDYIKDPQEYKLIRSSHIVSSLGGIGIISGLWYRMYLASKKEQYSKAFRLAATAFLFAGGVSVADEVYGNYFHGDFYKSLEKEWDRNQGMRRLTEMVLDFKEV